MEESLLRDAPPGVAAAVRPLEEEEDAAAEEGIGVDLPSWWLLNTTRAVEEDVVVTLWFFSTQVW